MDRWFTGRRLAIIPWKIKRPLVCGVISDDEICVSDCDNDATYVININTRYTQKVFQGGSQISVPSITACAPIDRNGIVCGMWRENVVNDKWYRCTTLYDRQWTKIRDISIKRDGNTCNAVFADVDSDKNILASVTWVTAILPPRHNNIYVINPADGTIVNTISMQGKGVEGEMRALSSGDIVVKTGRKKYTVISRSGEERADIPCTYATSPMLCIDKLTDTIYIQYINRDNVYAVNAVSRDGSMLANNVVTYKDSPALRCSDLGLRSRRHRPPVRSPCFVTPSGYLVVCDGNKLFVYNR